MAYPIMEGFSLSHAAILNGTTGAETADIYGIREGSLDVDTGDFDNTGDDNILSTWSWFNFATVQIQAGYVPFDTIALLTGATLTSSGTAPNDYYNLPLWNASSLNQVTRPMVVRCPAKNSDGSTRDLTFVLYKVQFEPIKFTGPSYKNGLVLNYGGRCLMSTVDEKGTALTDASIGRLMSRPRNL